MAGRQKGVVQRVQEKADNPKAAYIYCSSHELNSKASNVPEVYDMICLMQSLRLFY